jgi:hypothetical protein
MWCRWYRRNQLPQDWAQNRCLPLRMCEHPFAASSVGYYNCSDPGPTIGRNNSSGKRSFQGVTDEQAGKHVENGFVIRELTSQRTDIEDDIVYDIKHPDPAEIGLAISYEDQDPGDTEDRLVYQSKPQPSPHQKGPGPMVHSLGITPSWVHLPYPGWQRLSRQPSSPSIQLVGLSGEDDDDSDHQLPAFPPRPADFPSKCRERDPREEEPGSYRAPVDPEPYAVARHNLGDHQVHAAASPTNISGDRPRRLQPLPITPSSPFQKVHSMRTMLDVSLSFPQPPRSPWPKRSLTIELQAQASGSKAE